MIIQKQGYRLDVDVEKNVEYSEKLTLCDCPPCRNFYAQADHALPVLKEFLAELGVDVSRPDESGWYEEGEEIVYSFVAYTAVGKILDFDEHEIDLRDGDRFLSIVINENSVPNEQTEEYFVINVYGITLPWVLDEPLPEPETKPSLKKRIAELWRKMFKA